MTVSREIEPRALESRSREQHHDDATVGADNTDKSKTVSTTASHSSKSSSGSKKNNKNASKVSIQVDRTLLEELSQSTSRFEDDREDDDDENFEDSRLYLGPFCDIRRGCLIMDIVYLAAKIALLAFGIMAFEGEAVMARVYVDNSLLDDEGEKKTAFYVTLVKNCIAIVFTSLCLYGITKFRSSLVLLGTIWFGIDIIVSILTRRWLSVAFNAFFIYPHVMLYQALVKKKITPQNYAKLQRCCACNSNNDDDDEEVEENAV